MQQPVSLTDKLHKLFDLERYEEILDLSNQEDLTPSNDPTASQFVAASLFKLGRFPECVEWCQELSPSLGNSPEFASLHGAALRRNHQLREAESLLRKALEYHPGHITLSNNYANVLIDLKQFNKAREILTGLIAAYPTYTDAKENLARLNFQQDLTNTAEDIHQKKVSQQLSALKILEDPLIAAFSEQEITKPKDSTEAARDQDSGDLLQALPNRVPSKEIDEMLSLARKLAQVDPEQSLKDCAVIHRSREIEPTVYEVAAQAYIRLKLFGDAESCLLHAIALGSAKMSNFLNLANLVVMRGDQKLAVHYLEYVAVHAPDNQQLVSVRKALFPNGTPSTSTSPFQINADQAAQGSFRQ